VPSLEEIKSTNSLRTLAALERNLMFKNKNAPEIRQLFDAIAKRRAELTEKPATGSLATDIAYNMVNPKGLAELRQKQANKRVQNEHAQQDTTWAMNMAKEIERQASQGTRRSLLTDEQKIKRRQNIMAKAYQSMRANNKAAALEMLSNGNVRVADFNDFARQFDYLNANLTGDQSPYMLDGDWYIAYMRDK
jgi:hypothetical protein